MRKEDERFPFYVLGRAIGTTTGWDGDMETFTLYNFIPHAGVKFPEGDITICYPYGVVETYDEEGNCCTADDIIPLIQNIPPSSRDEIDKANI